MMYRMNTVALTGSGKGRSWVRQHISLQNPHFQMLDLAGVVRICFNQIK